MRIARAAPMDATSPSKRLRRQPEYNSDNETPYSTRTPLYESPDKKSICREMLQSGVSEEGTSTIAHLMIDTPKRGANDHSFHSVNSSPRTPGLGK